MHLTKKIILYPLNKLAKPLMTHNIILDDEAHSENEPRYFLIGFDGVGVLTVRFTLRGECIRIIGAGYWRKGKNLYERGMK